MIPKIKNIKPLKDYRLFVKFDDGHKVVYDVKEDIATLPGYNLLKDEYALFNQVQLDKSRTCVYWNKGIDLPSYAIYEYDKRTNRMVTYHSVSFYNVKQPL